MNLKNKIDKLYNRVSAISKENDDTVLVRTGACVVDDEGNYISGGTLTRVRKEQAGAFGILAIPAPCNKEEFSEKVKEFQDELKAERESQNG